MILRTICVRNYRSIVNSDDIPIQSLFAFVGENNSGKSNLISAIDCFMSAGAGGATKEDFTDAANPIIIKTEFGSLSDSERKRWRPYLVGGRLILEKHLSCEVDLRTGRDKVESQFHGYKAEPTLWYLSVDKIEARNPGSRVNWKQIVESNNLPGYFIVDDKCTKPMFEKALARYLDETDVDYDQPDLSSTQALGFPSNVVATLPSFYLLKAITDYSDEIDKRSTSSTFRRLMGDLGQRILMKDPRFQDIKTTLDTLKSLLNPSQAAAATPRLESLGLIETKFTELLKKLMPSVSAVSMSIDIDDVSDIFSAGVSLSVNDGVDTSVLAKGHGLQRCIVFTLLQTLILNERNQLLAPAAPSADTRTIILAIEEPELYIHPQLSKLFFDVMREFAGTDQVIYSTHSPLFIDPYDYTMIAIVRKLTAAEGTKVRTCDARAFEGLTDRKLFQGITRLNPSVSELFFARRVLVVEGPEDQIAITAVLQDLKTIKNRVEELDWSIIVAGGKESIPFFQRVLNGFSIPYAVLHDHDIVDDMAVNARGTEEQRNAAIAALANGNPVFKYPIKLETTLGLDHHFRDQYEAHRLFEEPANINDDLRGIIRAVFGIR